MIGRSTTWAALIAIFVTLARGAPRAHAYHLVAEEVSADYLVTHVLNVPLALTKLVTTVVTLSCQVTAGTDHYIHGFLGGPLSANGPSSVNSAGALSKTVTLRFRISGTNGGPPYRGSVNVRCLLFPKGGPFKVAEPPASTSPAGSGPMPPEYLQPGPRLTPDGMIVVEGTFP